MFINAPLQGGVGHRGGPRTVLTPHEEDLTPLVPHAHKVRLRGLVKLEDKNI